jgi:hypothetical protein
LKAAVNDALRLGLEDAMTGHVSRAPYHTPSTSLGGCLLGSLDDTSEVLAIAEGESFR